MSPQRVYTRATMHTYDPADCTACGHPNHVDWTPDGRLNSRGNFLPDESCGNPDCERHGRRPDKE